MNRKLIISGCTAAVVAAMAWPVYSQLSDKGLTHPVNHFPTWFTDSNGVTLQLCLDGDGLTGPCLYDEPIAGNAFSQATGFGPEAFWWSADSVIALPNSASAILVLALEAAYNTEDPADGQQMAFGRVRIRVDTPVAGQYKIWHPYLNEANGCAPEVYDAAAGRRAINITRDIGGNAPFDTMLTGEVGPFLVWDPAVAPAPPAGYVGNPQVEHPVVGGHCGINYFRIEGPEGSNLGGGSNIVQSNLFSVQGKIYDEGSTPPAIAPVRASYWRSTSTTTGATTARINLWVEAPPASSVAVTGLPQASQNGALLHDGNGGFFKRSRLNATYGKLVPDQVTFTASNVGGTTTRAVDLIDSVRITAAAWSPSTRQVRVVAITSDRIATSTGQAPTMSLRVGSTVTPMPQSGAAGRYAIALSGYTVPPARVVVTSSEGGSATEWISD